MPYYFYILRCADNSLYCGITTNLEKRLQEHNLNNSKGAKYTRSKRPVKLAYSKKYRDINSALKRESEVKKWAKVKKEELVRKNLFENR